jgi:uncharacterized protein
MSEFVITVRDIDDVGKDFDFELTPAWMTESLADAELRPQPAAGRFKVHAQKNGREILVHGRLKASLIANCVRCLGDAPFAVDTDIAALYSPTAAKHSAEPIELTEEDLTRMSFTGNEIDVGELIREHLVLECPMQPLCSEGCAGIEVPPHVRPPEDFDSGPEGVDPRLAPLMKIKGKLLPNKE